VITSFTAAKTAITAGTSTTLTAVFSNGSGAVNQGVGPVVSGTPVTVSPTADTTYTLAVGNITGIATVNATVSVVSAPVASGLAAAANPVPFGGSTTITPTFSAGIGSVDNGIGTVTSGTAFPSGAITASKTFTLTVTNSLGSTATKTLTLTPQTVAVGAISPATPAVTAGSSQTFAATPTGGATNAVTWSATVGTWSGSTWTAPATVGAVTITATSVDDPTKTATTTATVVAVPTASFTASTTTPGYNATNVTITPTLTGGSISGKVGTTLGGSEISSSVTSGIAVPVQAGGFTTATTYFLRVTNAANKTADYSVVVTPSTVSVSSVTPATPTVTVSLTKAFSATIAGGATNAVTWSATGGNFTGATWTAPATAGSYTIKATSVDDPTKTATTTATVVAVPTASFTASTTTPGYHATNVTITPTLTGGSVSGKVGTTLGGSEISNSVTSGIAVPVQTGGFTTATTYYLRVTNAASSTADYSVTVTPTTVSVSNVTPATSTVTVSLTKAFSATTTGGAANTVTWSATGGSFTGATWTAPGTAGSYTITATSVDDPTKTATTTATVVAVPTASFTASTTAPGYNATNVTITPTLTGGSTSGKVGTTLGGSEISSSVTSGTAIPVQAGGFTTATTYYLRVSNNANSTTDYSFTITPTSVIVSTPLPSASTIAPGTQSFTPSVTGGATNTVTWSATAGSFSGNVWTSPNTAGTATITATSVDDPTQHASTTITVSLPVITTQPASQNACTAAGVTLSVAANYAASYQWKKGGTDISGATASSYSITSAGPGDAGNYTCVVTNPAGSVTSGVASLVVGSSITTQPTGLSIYVAQTATFSVAVKGQGPFSYQWYKNNAVISGATSSIYTTPLAVIGDNGALFKVNVTDHCGNILTSNTAALTVSAGSVPPTITTQPLGQLAVAGSTTTSFTIAAGGTSGLTYQWYRIPAGQVTGSLIPGATSATYTLPGTSTAVGNDQDRYYCIVSNSYGAAASRNAILAVGNGILVQITGQPQPVYVGAGAAANFSMTASSLLPLSYQWQKAGPGSSSFGDITGATSATYTLASPGAVDNNSVFRCLVSNGSTSSVTSDAVALFVGSLSPINDLGDSSWVSRGSASIASSVATLTTTTAQAGSIVWPTLISTGNIKLSFTIAVSNATSPPADGFCLVLADPSLGATTSSTGALGQGLGAKGIPGFVLGFDTYQNGALPIPGDPPVPYLGVGRGEAALWENPWTNYNTNIPVLAESGVTHTHAYVVTIVQGQMTVTMDGNQVFSGPVSVPPVAYLMITASTGGLAEQVDISSLSATLSAPTN